MIVLDTNVLSELMRAVPDARVLAWADGQVETDMALTAIIVAEILYGIERLPDGKRKAALQDALNFVLRDEFLGRILAFDVMAAPHYAEIVSSRFRVGRPISMADAQIGAICRVNQARLATRNSKDFADIGISVLNPWLE